MNSRLIPTYLLFVLIALIFAFTAHADDSAVDDNPISTHAAKELSPASEGFIGLLDRQGRIVGEPYDPEQDLNPFFRDMSAKLNVRNFYLNRTGRGADNVGERISWAQGGSLLIESGMYDDFFDISIQGFTSQRWYGPSDKGGGGILKPDQESFTVLGVANPRFYVADHVGSFYRQRIDLPFLNSQDNRMVPNTFEGYIIGLPKENSDGFQWGAGYIDKIKQRSDDDFITMSEAAGAEGSHGMVFGGARGNLVEGLTLTVLEHFVQDTFNVLYAELDHEETFHHDEGTLRFGIQYMRHDSVGDDLLPQGDFSTQMWGGQSAVGFKGSLISLSVTGNSKESGLISPYGSYAGFTGSTVQDFNRAGEITWRVSGSYDLERLGLNGVKLNAAYARANRAVDAISGDSLPDQRETDVNIDIHPESLPGVWLRLRTAYIEEEGRDSFEEYRVIFNYDISRPS